MARRYRFPASMTPGFYCVMDAASETRVPGIVTVSTTTPRVYTYQRLLPPDAKHRKAWVAKELTAATVDELSRLIDVYFQHEQEKAG